MSEPGLATDASAFTVSGTDASASAVSVGSGRRHRAWIPMGLLAALVATFVILSSIYFVWPTTATPGRVGAVLNLNGGDEGSSSQLAVSLVKRGLAPVLLFSEGTEPSYCPHVAGVAVVCFLPKPARTVGEIDFAARYARSHNINSILIVANQAQTTRASLLAHRCFPGRSAVVDAPTPVAQLPGEVLYEWGATIKALIFSRGCN